MGRWIKSTQVSVTKKRGTNRGITGRRRDLCHNVPMHKRSSSTDVNEMAFSVISRAAKIGTPKKHRKNPAAVMLGRRGGLKGGKARAEKLSPDQRKEIARVAAVARWQKQAR
jgi:ribosome modulation factor